MIYDRKSKINIKKYTDVILFSLQKQKKCGNSTLSDLILSGKVLKKATLLTLSD